MGSFWDHISSREHWMIYFRSEISWFARQKWFSRAHGAVRGTVGWFPPFILGARRWNYIEQEDLKKWGRSEHISFAILIYWYIYIYYIYIIYILYVIPRSRTLFCKIMQASSKLCRVFSWVFSCFSCLHQPKLRSPSYVMIMPLQIDHFQLGANICF